MSLPAQIIASAQRLGRLLAETRAEFNGIEAQMKADPTLNDAYIAIRLRMGLLQSELRTIESCLKAAQIAQELPSRSLRADELELHPRNQPEPEPVDWQKLKSMIEAGDDLTDVTVVSGHHRLEAFKASLKAAADNTFDEEEGEADE